jgi:PPE-repeat protein
MEFTAFPPEVTSALIHAGPGAESLDEASVAWQRLAASLEETAGVNTATLAGLDGAWHGPSAAVMTQAVEPYLAWLRATAAQCQQMAVGLQDAVAAFNSARSAVLPVAAVTANRTRLKQLLATNRFGINMPAIAQTEDEYQGMWANNSAAMSRYEAASAQATTLPKFTSPAAIANPSGTAAQASATAAPAATTTAQSILSQIEAFDPNAGWVGLANTYANQFISSGFPINLLSYVAQNTSAQALQTVGGDIGTGLSEGQSALGAGADAIGRGAGAFGAAGLSAEPTAAIGAGMSIGKLTAPPAIVGIMPASQVPVQLASAATPITASDSGFPMPPLMPPPISSAGSGWRKRKQQKYDDISIGAELKGTVMPRPPSAG